MKALIIGAVGAFALLASPAFAATGYVGAAYNHDKVDTGPKNIEDDAFGVEGAVAFNAGASLGVDVDAAYSDGDKRDSTTAGAVHVYGKGGPNKFGGFVGLADAGSNTIYSVGVEGQHQFTQVTLAAALGYAKDDDANVDAWGIDAEARYFVNDNFRLDGKLGWTKVDFGGALGDDNLWRAGVGGEYQFSGAPVSIRAGYAHSEFNDTNVKDDAFTIGVRYNWGGSLKDRDTNGPSFAGLSSLTGSLGL